MELKLSLPTYPPLPKADVETRPKQVQEWLDALPMANSQEAGRKLVDAIAATNSVKLGEEARCALLELYRATAIMLRPSLQQLYESKSLPLSDKSQQVAALQRELYGELANGYKLALLDLSGRRANSSTSKLAPLALARVIACLGGVLEIYYETYAPAPAAIWSELHRLYWYAAKQNLHNLAIAEGDHSTVNMAYAKVLLLALADPYRLSQSQLALANAYLSQYGQQALLQALGPTENKHGLFLVRLDGDKPPKALMHYQGVTDARTDIILNSIPLARLLHQHIQALDAGQTPAKLGLPAGANPVAYREILKRLIKQWGVAPKRTFKRAPCQANAQVCGGISALHHMLSVGEIALPQDNQTLTVELSDTLHATGSQLTFNCVRWVRVNESAGGVALAKNPGSYTKIKVGDIIGVETGASGAWGVALVRWMQTDAEKRVELGAQMLAPQADAIAVKPVIAAANALFQPALLLPEVAALQQSACIVAARGSYQPLREFEVRSLGLIHIVRAVHLLEQTDSLDVFTFD